MHPRTRAPPCRLSNPPPLSLMPLQADEYGASIAAYFSSGHGGLYPDGAAAGLYAGGYGGCSHLSAHHSATQPTLMQQDDYAAASGQRRRRRSDGGGGRPRAASGEQRAPQTAEELERLELRQVVDRLLANVERRVTTEARQAERQAEREERRAQKDVLAVVDKLVARVEKLHEALEPDGGLYTEKKAHKLMVRVRSVPCRDFAPGAGASSAAHAAAAYGGGGGTAKLHVLLREEGIEADVKRAARELRQAPPLLLRPAWGHGPVEWVSPEAAAENGRGANWCRIRLRTVAASV